MASDWMRRQRLLKQSRLSFKLGTRPPATHAPIRGCYVAAGAEDELKSATDRKYVELAVPTTIGKRGYRRFVVIP
jgi:hypothetical protein